MPYFMKKLPHSTEHVQILIGAAQELETELKAAQTENERLRQMISEQRDKNALMRDETKQVHEAYNRLYKKYAMSEKRVETLEGFISSHEFIKKAESMLQTEKLRFREIATALYREVEYLKQIYPLKDFLTAKDAEVSRLKKNYQGMAIHDPQRTARGSELKQHIAERDQIRSTLEKTSQAFEQKMAELSSYASEDESSRTTSRSADDELNNT